MVKVCSVLFIQVVYVLCLYKAKISGERLEDHWSSASICKIHCTYSCILDGILIAQPLA